MAGMARVSDPRPASRYSLRTVDGRLRVIALAEAASWVGLLIGMYFKHLASPGTELGVQIFGPVHGLMFVLFVMIGIGAGTAFRWRPSTWSLAVLGAVVPLGSVLFLIWAERTGRIAEPEPVAAG